MRKDIFEILRAAVSKDALVGVVTNGYTMTPQTIPRVVELGLSNINISIDSLDPQIFDYMRAENRKGHTERVLESIRRVVSEIRRQGRNTKVFLKTVVCGKNVDSLIPLVEFVQDVGIAGIIFQPLEAVFGTLAPDLGDQWHKQTPLWPEDPQPMAEAAQRLIEMKGRGAPIVNPKSSIATWASYFTDPVHGTKGQLGMVRDNSVERHPCRIGHTHLYLAPNGDIQLCPKYPPIGNIANDLIVEAWRSDRAEELRREIARCDLPCTLSCLLDRGLKDSVKVFMKLIAPNE